MTLNKAFIKKTLMVFGLMVGALMLINAFPTALAGFITPEDNPASVRDATGGEGSIRRLALNIINFFLGFLGLLAVVMIIYGGVTYVTAAGKDDQIGNAKKIILYSIVGIIIILISFAIVNTVLGSATGVEGV